MMIKLIKNAEVHLSNQTQISDILLVNEKILEIGKNLDYNLKNIEIINGDGKKAIPGYIDQHVHVTGGGGEGGFSNRCPELNLSDCIRGGITTLVGLLGTDGTTRSVENLVAKVKGLKEEGLTVYCLTGSYEYPSPTITGSVQKDIVFIDEVIGVKIAISDHRCSNISKADLVRLASEARLGGVIAKKPGVVHVHVGAGKRQLDMIFDILETEDIPVEIFRPTHLDKNFDQAMKFANLGGYIDFTAGIDSRSSAEVIAKALLQAPKEKVTLSSDSNGSMPKWNAKKEIIGITVAKITTLHEVIKSMVLDLNIELYDAVKIATENVAKALSIYPQKGTIQEGSDADILLLDNNYDIDTVIIKGTIMMKNKIVLKKGKFEIE